MGGTIRRRGGYGEGVPHAIVRVGEVMGGHTSAAGSRGGQHGKTPEQVGREIAGNKRQR